MIYKNKQLPKRFSFLRRPAIHQGHTDDLIFETPTLRVYRSRMTKEDGMPYNDQITVEKYQTNKHGRSYWTTARIFNPRDNR